MNTTAKTIVDLLEVRHSKDVFVSECKTGPTQGASACPRLDAWAMKKSWVSPATYGYEVKVSRNDFLRDDKWQAYLPYCNLFSFVCPANLIAVDEVPDGVGLLWASKNLKKLYTKRKAKRREIDEPSGLIAYVLMARAHIDPEWTTERNNAEFWKDWLETGKSTKEIGWKVSKKIQRVIAREVDAAENRNGILQSENRNLAEVKVLCGKLGVDIGGRWGVENRFREALERNAGRDKLREIKVCVDSLTKLHKAMAAELAAPEEIPT